MDVVRSPAHGEKLKALLINTKLPASDRGRVEEAVRRYEKWIKSLNDAKGDAATLLTQLVGALNEYKRYVELDLIFDAEDDFLYRQKGQLKLDNTVLEEFLPYLFQPDLPLKFHPASIRVSADVTPFGAGGATCDRRSWSGLRSRSHVAVRLAA